MVRAGDERPAPRQSRELERVRATMSDYEYMSCAETAKLVRVALKAAFPGQKFSVRSSTYSMGASIDVSWVDGPTEAEVKRITGYYEGSWFNSSEDLKEYKPAVKLPDGRRVKFGADSVSLHRNYSVELCLRAANASAAKWGHELPELYISNYDRSADYQYSRERDHQPVGNTGRSVIDLCREMRHGMSAYVKPAQPAGPVKPAAPVAEAAIAPAAGAEEGLPELTTEGTWAWLRFDRKPSDAMLTMLRTTGWHWSRRRSAWFSAGAGGDLEPLRAALRTFKAQGLL